MALLAGTGAALAVLSAPVGLLEMLVGSAGISEALPAAAPPLGLNARLLIAGFAAAMAVGIAWAVTGYDHSAPGIGAAKGDRKMGFALSKLAGSRLGALTRARVTESAPSAPVLRRADAHPDAPARPPIFASRDFGGEDIFAHFSGEEAEERGVSAMEVGLDLPRAPAPLDEAELADVAAVAPPIAARAVGPVLTGPSFMPAFASRPEQPEVIDMPAVLPSVVGPEPLEPRPLDSRPLATLSIGELTERLERGLSRRSPAGGAAEARVIADMPVVPPVPVRDHVEPDLDEALHAALNSLRTMASRAR